jgi:ABC-type enterochelin transport system permease subunit
VIPPTVKFLQSAIIGRLVDELLELLLLAITLELLLEAYEVELLLELEVWYEASLVELLEEAYEVLLLLEA